MDMMHGLSLSSYEDPKKKTSQAQMSQANKQLINIWRSPTHVNAILHCINQSDGSALMGIGGSKGGPGPSKNS